MGGEGGLWVRGLSGLTRDVWGLGRRVWGLGLGIEESTSPA